MSKIEKQQGKHCCYIEDLIEEQNKDLQLRFTYLLHEIGAYSQEIQDDYFVQASNIFVNSTEYTFITYALGSKTGAVTDEELAETLIQIFIKQDLKENHLVIFRAPITRQLWTDGEKIYAFRATQVPKEDFKR